LPISCCRLAVLLLLLLLWLGLLSCLRRSADLLLLSLLRAFCTSYTAASHCGGTRLLRTLRVARGRPLAHRLPCFVHPCSFACCLVPLCGRYDIR
jgi:hypothetical protein